MICEKCGSSIVDEHAKFCARCGTALKVTPPATCKACGKTLSDPSARFCPYCGSPTQEEKTVMVCPECAREYEEGFLYCETCGRRLQPKQHAQPQPASQPKQPSQHALESRTVQ